MKVLYPEVKIKKAHLLATEDRPFIIAGGPAIGHLHLSYSDSAFWANFNTGLTAETLVSVYSFSFTINHFINLSRASAYTFFITSTFVFVYNDFPHNEYLQEKNRIIETIVSFTLSHKAVFSSNELIFCTFH
jgi:hypothetical protein